MKEIHLIISVADPETPESSVSAMRYPKDGKKRIQERDVLRWKEVSDA